MLEGRKRRLLTGALGLTVLGLLTLGSCVRLSRLPKVAPAPRAEVVLEDVTVVNPGVGRREHMRVRVVDGRIVSLQPATPTGGPARYVLPGLIDMHVHDSPLPVDEALYSALHLAHGVTSVRNLGGPPFLLRMPRAPTDTRAAPRLFACGPLLDGDPSAFRVGTERLTTPEQARQRVRELTAQGADCIKAFITLKPEVLAALREESRAQGVPLVGHVPRSLPLEEAHLDDIQHLTGVPQAPSAAFTAGPEFLAWLEAWKQVDAARVEAVARSAREDGAAHTPTLVVWQGLVRLGEAGAAGEEPSERLLPRWTRQRVWKAPRPPLPFAGAYEPRLYEAAREAWPRMLEVVGALHRAGVPLQVGTDVLNPYVVPGASLHEELRLLVRAGLTPEQALEAATRVPGQRLGRRARVGVLEEGAAADLLVFERDPTEDLAHLDSLELILVDGRAWRREALMATVKQQLEATEGLPYRWTSGALAGVLEAVF